MTFRFKLNKQKRLKKHGFRARMKTACGAAIIRMRRKKGRAKLSVSDEKKLRKAKRA